MDGLGFVQFKLRTGGSGRRRPVPCGGTTDKGYLRTVIGVYPPITTECRDDVKGSPKRR